MMDLKKHVMNISYLKYSRNFNFGQDEFGSKYFRRQKHITVIFRVEAAGL